MTNIAPTILNPPTSPRGSAPLRIAVGLLAFLALLLGVTGVVVQLARTIGAPDALTMVLGSCAFAASSIALVAGLTRWERRSGPWTRRLRDLGLQWNLRAGTGLLIGTVATASTLVLLSVVERWVGLAGPNPELANYSGGEIAAGLGLSLVAAFVLQGFPEELFFRGFVLNTVRLRLPMAVLVSSTVFGALHILSQSPATGVLERFVLYPLAAVALGFACSCARLGQRTLWAAVGVHGGLHVGMQLSSIFAVPENYAVHLVGQTIVMTLLGLGLVLAPGPHHTIKFEGNNLEAPPAVVS